MTILSKTLTLSILTVALGVTGCDGDAPQGPIDDMPADLSPDQMAIAMAIAEGVPLSEIVDADGERIDPAAVEGLGADPAGGVSPLTVPFNYKEPECDWSAFPADFGPNASNWGIFSTIEFAFNYDSPVVLGQAACEAVCDTCDAGTEYSLGLYEWCTCRLVPIEW